MPSIRIPRIKHRTKFKRINRIFIGVFFPISKIHTLYPVWALMTKQGNLEYPWRKVKVPRKSGEGWHLSSLLWPLILVLPPKTKMNKETGTLRYLQVPTSFLFPYSYIWMETKMTQHMILSYHYEKLPQNTQIIKVIKKNREN